MTFRDDPGRDRDQGDDKDRPARGDRPQIAFQLIHQKLPFFDRLASACRWTVDWKVTVVSPPVLRV